MRTDKIQQAIEDLNGSGMDARIRAAKILADAAGNDKTDISSALGALLESLNSRDESLRSNAVIALYNGMSTGLELIDRIPQLKKTICDVAGVRYYSIQIMSELAGRGADISAALPELAGALASEKDAQIKTCLAETFYSMAAGGADISEAIPALITALNTPGRPGIFYKHISDAVIAFTDRFPDEKHLVKLVINSTKLESCPEYIIELMKSLKLMEPSDVRLESVWMMIKITPGREAEFIQGVLGFWAGEGTEVKTISADKCRNVPEAVDRLIDMAQQRNIAAGGSRILILPNDDRSGIAREVKAEADRRGWRFERHIPAALLPPGFETWPDEDMLYDIDDDINDKVVISRINGLDARAKSEYEAGDIKTALSSLRQALRLGVIILGWMHPLTVGVLVNLVDISGAAGRAGNKSETVRLLKKAFVEFKKYASLDRMPDDSAFSGMRNLSSRCADIGDVGLGAKMLTVMANIRLKMEGREHPNYIAALNNLAEFYRANRIYDKAGPLFQKVEKYIPLEGNAL